MTSLHSLSTLNSFLLAILVPITKYLQNVHTDFEPEFRSACLSNQLFASYEVAHPLNPIDERQKKIFELTQNFMRDMAYIVEHIDCGCSNKSAEECASEVQKCINAYLQQLIVYIDLKTVHANIVDSSAAPGFKEDYVQTKANLLERKLDMAAAEEQLLYWQAAVTDIILSDALVVLRYSFLESY